MQKALVATEPLNQTQQDQLQKLLDDNHVGHVTPKVIASAQGFLSPAQLQALHGLFQEQQAAQQRRRVPQSPSASGGK